MALSWIQVSFSKCCCLSPGSRVATVVMSLTQVSAMKYCDGAAARLHSVQASDWSADSDPGL